MCEHLTSAEMLRDPQIAAAYREGLAAAGGTTHVSCSENRVFR